MGITLSAAKKDEDHMTPVSGEIRFVIEVINLGSLELQRQIGVPNSFSIIIRFMISYTHEVVQLLG